VTGRPRPGLPRGSRNRGACCWPRSSRCRPRAAAPSPHRPVKDATLLRVARVSRWSRQVIEWIRALFQIALAVAGTLFTVALVQTALAE